VSASPIRSSAARLVRRIRTPRGVIAVVVAAGLVGVRLRGEEHHRIERGRLIRDALLGEARPQADALGDVDGVHRDARGRVERHGPGRGVPRGEVRDGLGARHRRVHDGDADEPGRDHDGDDAAGRADPADQT
jgi:hypothetical protein